MNKTIETLKSLAICLVVIGHSVPGKANEDNTGIVILVEKSIYTFHMPLFMFLSGYLFVTYSINNTQKYVDSVSFISQKFKRLIIPYLTLGSIGFILKGIVSNYSYRPIEMSFSFYIHGLFYPLEAAVQMYWFLITLFIIFLFFPIFKKILNSDKALLSLMLLTLFFLGNVLNTHNIGFLNISGVVNYVFYFFSGCMLSRYYSTFPAKIGKPSILLFFLLMFTISLALFIDTDNKIIKIIIALIGICLSFSIAAWINNNQLNLFSFINGYSYPIFLLSWFVQNPIRVLYQINILSYYLTIFLMITLGLFMPIWFSKFIERGFPRVSFIVGR
ncbi:MAG: acyltransferase [Desulfobacterales bacterium]|jgi:fucose 4-O-acetylase-like acetyltransferase